MIEFVSTAERSKMAFSEKYHYFRQETGVLHGLPEENFSRLTLDEFLDKGEYLGRIAENEIVGNYDVPRLGSQLVFVKRNIHKMSPFYDGGGKHRVPTFNKICTMGGWHGLDVDTNLVIGFSKEDLQKIVDSMQENDVFNVAHLPQGYQDQQQEEKK